MRAVDKATAALSVLKRRIWEVRWFWHLWRGVGCGRRQAVQQTWDCMRRRIKSVDIVKWT